MASVRLQLQPASGLQEGAARVRRTLPWLLAAVTVDAMAATAHPRCRRCLLAGQTTAGNGCSVLDLVFWPGVLDRKALGSGYGIRGVRCFVQRLTGCDADAGRKGAKMWLFARLRSDKTRGTWATLSVVCGLHERCYWLVVFPSFCRLRREATDGPLAGRVRLHSLVH
jgi:hypothetical protein